MLTWVKHSSLFVWSISDKDFFLVLIVVLEFLLGTEAAE